MNLFIKKNRLTDIENQMLVTKEDGCGGGINQGLEIHTAICEINKQQGPTV